MSAQRLREAELDFRELAHQVVAGGRQILAHVHARREKVWHQDHTLRTCGDAHSAAGFDAWLGDFEIRGDHNLLATLTELFGDMVQVRVRVRLSATMRNEE